MQIQRAERGEEDFDGWRRADLHHHPLSHQEVEKCFPSKRKSEAHGNGLITREHQERVTTGGENRWGGERRRGTDTEIIRLPFLCEAEASSPPQELISPWFFPQIDTSSRGEAVVPHF